MKNFLLKALLLAALLVFLFRGGLRILVIGWRLFLPMLAVAGIYMIVRKLLKENRLAQKEQQRPLGQASARSTDEVIVICPHCLQPKGSCPKCK